MGATLADVDLEAARGKAETAIERQVTDTDLASYLMYPKVFTDFASYNFV